MLTRNHASSLTFKAKTQGFARLNRQDGLELSNPFDVY